MVLHLWCFVCDVILFRHRCGYQFKQFDVFCLCCLYDQKINVQLYKAFCASPHSMWCFASQRRCANGKLLGIGTRVRDCYAWGYLLKSIVIIFEKLNFSGDKIPLRYNKSNLAGSVNKVSTSLSFRERQTRITLVRETSIVT